MSSPAAGGYEDANIEVQSFRTGQRKVLHRGGYFPHYLPSGHLVYMHDGVLFAAPMDAKRLELTGPPVPVLEDVEGLPSIGGARFAFSQNGTLVYSSGTSVSGRPLVWLDPSGKAEPLRAKPAVYQVPRLSPDGKRLALAVNTSGTYDIWVYEWERDIMTRKTFGPRNNRYPLWTPDGKGIIFESAEKQALYWLRADGTGTPQPLTSDGKGLQIPMSFSPDARRLVFEEQSHQNDFDLWTLAIDWSEDGRPKPGKPELFLRTPFNEQSAAVSPDGRWLAYSSDETGTFEVYVRPFSGGSSAAGGKWQVSSGGGYGPHWSHGAHELVYRTQDGHIMVAGYTVSGDSFAAVNARRWCEKPLLSPTSFLFASFDLAPDGKRIVAISEVGNADDGKSSSHAIFLQNFFDELRRRVK
jgi:serine/threonine-protein kinase